MLWCETSKPDIAEAKKFAEAMHAEFPGKLLAYNCSPSFNWKKKLDDATIAKFQRELGAMGYKFQFVTLAGFHALNYSMFELAHGYRDRGHGRVLRIAGGGVRRRGRWLHRHANISTKSALDTSTTWPASSRAEKARPRLCAARPKKSSFVETR